MPYLTGHIAAVTAARMSVSSVTPQTAPLPGREAEMIRNSAGGYTFAITPMSRFRRFLILGSESGTYYASAKDLTVANITSLCDLIENGQGLEAINLVVKVSVDNLAPKVDPGILALAVAMRVGKLEVAQAAREAVHKVCRIPTHLFMLMEYLTTLGCKPREAWPAPKKKVVISGKGIGRGMRNCIAKWYNSKTPRVLAHAVTKYKQREGWSHVDVLRVGHVMPATRAHDLVFRFITRGVEALKEAPAAAAAGPASVVEAVAAAISSGVAPEADDWEKVDSMVEDVKKMEMDIDETPAAGLAPKLKRLRGPKVYSSVLPGDLEAEQDAAEFLLATDRLIHCTEDDQEKAVELIRKHRLAREHVPSNLLRSVLIWQALLEDMPLTALIRNLGKMTSIGLLSPLSDAAHSVVRRLADPVTLKKARIHPFNILVALNQYKAGRGQLGSLSWDPNSEISTALDKAFYLAFDSVEPTGKRHLIALDVSGSMAARVLGSADISCSMASTAMAMTVIRTEERTHVMAFCDKFVKIDISATDTIDSALSKTKNLPFGGTDCSLPIQYALEHKIPVDVFVVYTDNETYFGKIHPIEMLKKYREEMGILDAKLAVVAMSSSGNSIADPKDVNSLDIVGFDSSAPSILREFALGNF